MEELENYEIHLSTQKLFWLICFPFLHNVSIKPYQLNKNYVIFYWDIIDLIHFCIAIWLPPRERSWQFCSTNRDHSQCHGRLWSCDDLSVIPSWDEGVEPLNFHLDQLLDRSHLRKGALYWANSYLHPKQSVKAVENSSFLKEDWSGIPQCLLKFSPGATLINIFCKSFYSSNSSILWAFLPGE